MDFKKYTSYPDGLNYTDYYNIITKPDTFWVEFDSKCDEIESINNDVYNHNQLLFKTLKQKILDTFIECGISIYNNKAKTTYKPFVNKAIESIPMPIKVIKNKYGSKELYVRPKFKSGHVRFEVRNKVYEGFVPVCTTSLEYVNSLKKIIKSYDDSEKEQNDEYKVCKLYLLSDPNYSYTEDIINNMTLKDVICQANSLAQEEYYTKNYRQGDVVDISCCSECSSYTIGERRCSCGNSRVSPSIDGSVYRNDFYVYFERY